MVNDRTRLYLPIVMALGAASLALIAILVFKGVLTSQNAVPSEAVLITTDPNKCQGNRDPSARCFKCETGANKNNPIGILDFACFAGVYGKAVGFE